MRKISLFIFILSSHLVYGIKLNQNLNYDFTSIDTLSEKGASTIDYIKFYQKYISGIRGHECPMYPSCSNFGLKSFSEKGFFQAMVLTSDRLMRCGHDHNYYQLTLRNSGFKYIDFPFYQNYPQDLIYRKNTYYFAYSDFNQTDSSYLFIQKLINNQYFNDALLEIMKIEFSNKVLSLDLYINKIICLKSLEEYEKAIFDYENNCPGEYKTNSELLFQMAIIQYKLANYKQSLVFCDLSMENNLSQNNYPKILNLKALNYINLDEYENSKLTLELIKSYDSFKPDAEFKIQIIEQNLKKNKKNSILAGGLSIIPGLGYAYTGHKQTAITAFLLNGLLGYATYTNLKQQNYGMSILTGVFSLSFYFGNIYGASKSATRYNDRKKSNLINKLEYNYSF